METVPFRATVMREAIPGKLWIGGAGSARDARAVLAAGVQAVVDLAMEEPPAALPRGLVYCRFPLTDGQQDSPEILRAAIEGVACLLRQEIATLVCCGAGMSRAPSVAAGAVALALGGSADDRLKQLVHGHPHDVSPSLWAMVRGVCADAAK